MSWDYHFFPPSKPKAAKGGIKAQSKRGKLGGETWWAKRWIAVLESFNIGARLNRGRTYARSGQVLSIDISKGNVKARVQGSRTKPYEVSIKVKELTKSDWAKLTEVLSSQAIFAAKLLAGDMPQEIEQAFKSAGLSLFPDKLKDLDTNCSCPDWSNPCKHIAAVYYLLGEEFDRNPFLIFTLRGMSRDELLPQLSGFGEKDARETGKDKAGGKSTSREPSMPPEPLSADEATFWGGGELPEDFFGEVRTPPMRAALLKRLGKFPFWRGNQGVIEALEPVYGQASQRGMDAFLSGRS